ncbi:uncharacterized protein EAE98_011245 [Botrytis deweyae]|uniref:Sesquiterpene cyclase n=1 Tax=Botrytis deweyae TaxID=2478750 RepID=A0ABQ7I694_9HELO|nr:uncharacterized protein EAE98_011245 [Botrytis deweyae]KAF7915160.1 hypothetical protein EAE98_011245 [Botrytis deweyae]
MNLIMKANGNGSLEKLPVDFDNFTNGKDADIICPIKYIYDYLPQKPKWLQAQQVTLNDVLQLQSVEIQGDTRNNRISIYPGAAHLPVHTGLGNFRQSKHWEANERATTELLELFAQDQHCKDAMLTNGQSMATLAKHQLRTPVLDTYSRFSIYMFADADEKRIQLLAQSVILIFIFDDMWENASSEFTSQVRDDFIGRIQGNVSKSIADTPLQRRMHEIRQGFLDGDEEDGGNAGAEVLQELIDFCRHEHPEEFSSVREYLDYRYDDIANRFTWACTKFSLHLRVDLHSPKLRRLFGYLGDQISIANDIASYDKEAKQFLEGRAKEMINLVHTTMQVNCINDVTAAKSMAYAIQLWTENEILEELRALSRQGQLSAEEWRLVDGCLVAASGNLLTSIVISRYGGEEAKVAL